MKTVKRKFLTQGKLLRELRYEKALSLHDLASLTGIQTTRLHRLESCTHEIKVGEIMSLERFYECDIYNTLKNLGGI